MKTKKLFVTGDNHILRVKLAVIDVAKIKSDSRRGDVLARILREYEVCANSERDGGEVLVSSPPPCFLGMM